MNRPAIAKLCALLTALAALAVALLFTPMPTAQAIPAVTIWTVMDSGDGVATPGNCPGASCRLRDALAASALGDTIVFSLTYPATITRLLPGSFDITHSVTISGPGASNLAVSGNNTGRVFLIGSSGLTVTISGLTIRNGNTALTGAGIHNAGVLTLTDSVVFSNTVTSVSGIGGGILNNGTMTVMNTPVMSNTAGSNGGGIYNSGTVTVSSTLLFGNSAPNGGGIYNGSALTVNDSTFSGNSAIVGGGIQHDGGSLNIASSTFLSNTATGVVNAGGGIHISGTVTITNSTLTGNSASGTFSAGGGIYVSGTLTMTNTTLVGNNVSGGISGIGGGIRNNAGTTTLRNSIVANNTATTSGANCSGTISDDGGNNLQWNPNSGCGFALAPADPRLGPLANNGGSTQTMALLPGSPAIDAGNDANCPSTDQRGTHRPIDAHCDIGAYEAGYLFLPLILK